MWPECEGIQEDGTIERQLSIGENAKNLIIQLLDPNAELRPDAKNVKSHNFFSEIDWINLRNMEPPFVPSPENQFDTSYFDGSFLS